MEVDLTLNETLRLSDFKEIPKIVSTSSVLGISVSNVRDFVNS